MTKAKRPQIGLLLVDDREENLVALEALLRRDDLDILKARSGQEALEHLLNREIGLALIDVQMPDMDGFELAELMRGTERSRRIPIIFVTAGAQDSKHVFEGYDAGAVDFLHKPIDSRILRNKVDTFVEMGKQRLELSETLRFHETFVAALGHDLRNPLNSIAMIGQILQQSLKEPSQKDMAARLLASSKRMTSMLDQLYDLSRSRLTGGLTVDRRRVNVESTVRALIDEHKLTATSPIEFHCAGPVEAFCDGPRITQVVSNLISNAVKHGGDAEPVKVTLSSTPTEVRIGVHNRGKIDPHVAEHIFDPFVSGEMSKRRDGLGLGLYIVDQIVRAHGGRIDIASSDAEGTTFSVHFPIK